MDHTYTVIALIIGLLVGFIVARLTAPNYKKLQELQKEIEDKKETLDKQQQDLTAHFADAAEMMDTLGKNYTKLYKHMAKNSSELLPELAMQDNPFFLSVEKEKSPQNEEITEAPPKDYANGATGALKSKPEGPISPTKTGVNEEKHAPEKEVAEKKVKN